MHRFVKVRGKPGILVRNPHAMAANPPRFAGQQIKATPPDEWKDATENDHPDLAAHYEPIVEVLILTQDLQRAIDREEIVQIAKCDARNHEAAAKAMADVVASVRKVRAHGGE